MKLKELESQRAYGRHQSTHEVSEIHHENMESEKSHHDVSSIK